MLDILLYLLIVAGFTSIGFLKAAAYSGRAAELKQLLNGFQRLESEMKYRRESLPRALLSAGKAQNRSGPCFFEILSYCLSENRSMDIAECWKSSMDTAFRRSSLTADDLAILSSAGPEIGASGIEEQIRMFRRICTDLTGNMESAREDAKTKGRMYRGLGIATGLTLVILLL